MGRVILTSAMGIPAHRDLSGARYPAMLGSNCTSPHNQEKDVQSVTTRDARCESGGNDTVQFLEYLRT